MRQNVWEKIKTIILSWSRKV